MPIEAAVSDPVVVLFKVKPLPLVIENDGVRAYVYPAIADADDKVEPEDIVTLMVESVVGVTVAPLAAMVL